MWMMLLHLHVNQKSDYDDDMIDLSSKYVGVGVNFALLKVN